MKTSITLRNVGPPRLQDWPPRACDGADPALFFPGNDTGGRRVVAEDAAKALCNRCAAVRECRAYAVPIVDLAGIWGSLNVNERKRARKQQKEG